MINDPEIQEPAPEESVIVIRFSAPNSTLMDVKYHNVSPLQAVAAAFVLNNSAEDTIKQATSVQQQREQISKIAVPGR